jgi:hypothetical protein
LIVAEQPTREFGKRRPAAIEAAQPVKRSSHVALLVMGAFAVGGGAYALMPGKNCGQNRLGMASDPQTSTECPPRGSSSSGNYGAWGGWSLRSRLFGGDISSSRSPSGTSSDASSGGVTRGGFGSFARAFAAHFSGGG